VVLVEVDVVLVVVVLVGVVVEVQKMVYFHERKFVQLRDLDSSVFLGM
ncbi:hypothetical protein A2U01_0092098, partial [Trifolium medium]|nr:hypothetical protein [Trifolium medium]